RRRCRGSRRLRIRSGDRHRRASVAVAQRTATVRELVLSPPAVSRAEMTIEPVPAAPAATTNDTRYRPPPSETAVFRTAAFPGWMKAIVGDARSASVVATVTVSVWPAATAPEETVVENASATTECVSDVVPIALDAVTLAT